MELKAAIWDTCGGIPLYLFSMLDLLDQNCTRSPHRSRNVGDPCTPSEFFLPRLTRGRADAVLRERWRMISWKATTISEEFQQAPLVLVALFAIAHEPSRVERFCQLADIPAQVRRSVRRTLLREGMLRQNGNEWAFDFQHELLRQTAIAVGRDEASAQQVIETILEKVSEGSADALDLELRADLASWAGFHDDSTQALNAAFELIRGTANFRLAHRVLFKLCAGLERRAFGSAKSYLEYLTCRSELAWATWNTESLLEAKEEYKRIVMDATTRASDVLHPSIAEAFAADAQRRVVGLDLHLEDLSSFVASAQTALELNGHSVAFHSVMNRLVLYCAEFSHVDLGLELAQLTLEVFGNPRPWRRFKRGIALRWRRIGTPSRPTARPRAARFSAGALRVVTLRR